MDEAKKQSLEEEQRIRESKKLKEIQVHKEEVKKLH